VVRLTDPPQEAMFQGAEAWAGRLAAMQPAPWAPAALEDWAEALPEGIRYRLAVGRADA
jgi:hypothetical protein